MSRQIYCRACGEKPALASEDIARGWTSRKVYVSLAKPGEKHGVTINGVFHKVDDVHCDICDKVITGEIAVCVSRIPPEKEMREWESEYGTVLSEDTVKLHDKLAGYEKVGGPKDAS